MKEVYQSSKGPIIQAIIEIISLFLIIYFVKPALLPVAGLLFLAYIIYVSYRILSFKLEIDQSTGIIYRDKLIEWSDVKGISILQPGMVSDGIVDVLTHSFSPDIFPPKSVITISNGQSLKKIKLIPVVNINRLVSTIDKNSHFKGTEGQNRAWEEDKKEVLDTISSAELADREYALDILERHAKSGNQEALQLLQEYKA